MKFQLQILQWALRGAGERLTYRLAAVIVVLVAGVVLIPIVGSLLTLATIAIAEGRIDSQWAENFEALTTLPQQHPPHTANLGALELEGLSATLGIDLAPFGLPERAHPTTEQRQEFEAIADNLSVFVTEIVAADGVLPQAGVRRFLERHQETVQEIVAKLNQGASPQWDSDITLGGNAPLPNLVGLERLHSLLAASATQFLSASDSTEALRTIEASWRLNTPNLIRPERACVLAGSATLQLQLAQISRLELAPGEWLDRLENLDLEHVYLNTLRTDAWNALVDGRTGRFVNKESFWVRTVFNYIAQPFLRWASHDRAEVMLWPVGELGTRDIRHFERAQFAAELRSRIPRWNHLAAVDLPDVGGGWLQIARSSLGIELTQYLLRIQRFEQIGDWTGIELLNGENPSSVTGLVWIIDASQDRVTIRLLHEPALPVPETFPIAPLHAETEIEAPPPTPGDSDEPA
ncbi:MAG: hypothetical protein GY906_33385 [bacterium]|nr:hypothetical protein [bacterium]